MSFVASDHNLAKSLASAPSQRRPRRWTISYRAVAPVAMTCDVLIIYLTSILSAVAYHLQVSGSVPSLSKYVGFGSIVAALFVLLGERQDLYDPSKLLNFKSQIRQVALNWLGIFLFLTAIAFLMKAGASFSRGTTLIFAFSGLAALIGERAAWRILLADGSAVRRFSSRKVALIADEDSAINSGIFEALSRHAMQPTYQCVAARDRNTVTGWEEAIDHAIPSLRGSDVEKIIVSTNLNQWAELDKLLSRLRVLPLPVNLIPVGPASELFKLPSRTIGDTVAIELQRRPLTLVERAIKRTFDIVVATTMLVLLLPLMLMTAIAIKSDSRGPIIFRQRRCGFNGRKFNIFKFRTMSVLEDGETIVQAKPDDVRITRIGKWLRRISMDELPQLFNVLRGEMSLVGPRPHAMAHDMHFDKLLSHYAFRQHVKPGIMGAGSWSSGQDRNHRRYAPTGQT